MQLIPTELFLLVRAAFQTQCQLLVSLFELFHFQMSVGVFELDSSAYLRCHASGCPSQAPHIYSCLSFDFSAISLQCQKELAT